MPSTSDFPVAGKGASGKKRSRRERTWSGHFAVSCARIISPLVRNPCRQRNRGFRPVAGRSPVLPIPSPPLVCPRPYAEGALVVLL